MVAWRDISTAAATIIIAASDSSAMDKVRADYVCTGTGDQSIINAAIARLPVYAAAGGANAGAGGVLFLCAGTYTLTDSIVWTDRMLSMRGAGGAQTILIFADAVATGKALIKIPTMTGGHQLPYAVIADIKLDGNLANQGSVTHYGINVESADAAYDVQFMRLWFKTIKGHAIRLGGGHNHAIDRCAFEAIDGACVLAVPDTVNNYGPTATRMSDCFVADVYQVVQLDGTFPGSVPGAWNIHDNCISGVEKTAFQLPGDAWFIHDNAISVTLDTDATYPIIEADLGQNAGTKVVFRGLSVHHNYFYTGGSKHPTAIFGIKGSHQAGRGTWDLIGASFDHNIIQASSTPIGVGLVASGTVVVAGLAVTGNQATLKNTTGYLVDFHGVTSARITLAGNTQHQGKPINADDNYGGLCIVGNAFADAASGTIPVGAAVRDNTGIVTEYCGVETIPNGETAVGSTASPTQINHHLTAGVAGSISDLERCIHVAWAEDPGNATAVWPDNADANSFEIHCDADPGKDVDVYWWVGRWPGTTRTE